MNDLGEILLSLNSKQRAICESEDNFILTACPGSGKTRVITHRLAYLAQKYAESSKLNIAITYTNRAASEIENRIEAMGVEATTIWTGTIHQFCMTFIIRPYAMYHSRLKHGYKIIDEYIKDTYGRKIAKELNIFLNYWDNPFAFDDIVSKYKQKLQSNKEIDFDMILLYAKELITTNRFIAENISDIIRSIHVDEYQDTNEHQYDILSEIVKANNAINILFVGDVNQAIFGGLGGVAKSTSEIKLQFGIDFSEATLNLCYRSTQRLIDYYSVFEVSATGAESAADWKNEAGLIKYSYEIHKNNLVDRIVSIIEKQLEHGIPENEICIIAPQWISIYSLTHKLRESLPTINFDAPNISPIKYDPLNVFFIITKLLFTKHSIYRGSRRKEALGILTILRDDFNMSISEEISKLDILRVINSTPIIKDDGILTAKKAVLNVLNFLLIELDGKLKESYDSFFEKIQSRVDNHNLSTDYDSVEKCFKESSGIVINTIHGIKGEEYETVVAFNLLNGKLPHWDYIMNPHLKTKRNEETKHLLYVLASRAKKNLFLFSEKGHSTKNSEYVATDELKNYLFNYD